VSIDQPTRLASLLDRLAREYSDIQAEPNRSSGRSVVDAEEPILGEFLRSMLMWECTSAKAEAAFKRVQGAVVDFNELRVCLPRELVSLMGETYPRARERADRMRAALSEVFTRAHSVTLRQLTEMGKREAFVYLESLSGVPRYVAARVALLCLGNHVMPVDSRVLRVLTDAHAAAPDETEDGAAGILERRIRAGELATAYLHLQAKADEHDADGHGQSGNGAKTDGAAPERTKRSGRSGRAGGAGAKPRPSPPRSGADAS